MALQRCSFCGKAENEVRKLLAAGKEPGDAKICDSCVDIAKDRLTQDARRDAANSSEPLKTPAEVKQHLDQYVIGQDRAKTDVAVAIYDHYKRREIMRKNKGKITIEVDGKPEDVEIDKSNILLLGPSGTGKTHIARNVARALNIPFYIGDATKLTQAGYVGDDVESLLQGLIAAADNDLERAEWGIIFIDEIDKLARKSGRNASGYRDVTGEGVQQALLKMVEGSKVAVPRGMGAKMVAAGMGGADCIDTTNILFVCAGSFAGIEECVEERVNQRSKMGFGGEERKRYMSKDKSEVYKLVEEADILEFGLIPELVGRLPVLTSTYQLTEAQMLEVFTKPKNSILKQARALFSLDNIDLQLDDAAARAIARKATTHETGCRAMRTIMERILAKAKYEVPSDPTIGAIRVTEEVVEGKAEPIYIKRKMVVTA
jgi:ATP-dependent Clp protease ATP-binding subunit ClpX